MEKIEETMGETTEVIATTQLIHGSHARRGTLEPAHHEEHHSVENTVCHLVKRFVFFSREVGLSGYPLARLGQWNGITVETESPPVEQNLR
jgi:hypothetical protein